MEISAQSANKEISATKRWGIIIVFGLLTQTGGMIYWFSSWSTQVRLTQEQQAVVISANTSAIEQLKTNAPVVITREQLNDILASRDARIDDIDTSMTRIETKLDTLINK